MASPGLSLLPEDPVALQARGADKRKFASVPVYFQVSDINSEGAGRGGAGGGGAIMINS